MGGDIGEIKLGSERELYKYINHHVAVKRGKKKLFKENLNASKASDQSKDLDGNIGCRDKNLYGSMALLSWYIITLTVFYVLYIIVF